MTRKRKSYDIPIETGDEDVTPSAEAPEEEDPETMGEESPEATLDHLRRLQAEFANYRRRTDRERLETGVWAQGRLVERLLPILDDFDRATATAEEGGPASLKGFQLIREKLHRTLTEAGLERIDVAGADFDPERHEALLTQQVEPDLAGKVLAEIEPGYLFKGRLLRPARVQVGIAGDE
jgi:molecular chaperone GrpE